MNKKIIFWEPYFFIFFGLFHLHRIWGLINKESYTSFWLDLLHNRGPLYFILMAILTILCILGIITFIRNIKNNYWWRYVYLIGGGYLLFDLCAILYKFDFWYKLLDFMFDTSSNWYVIFLLMFILIGAFSFGIGISLIIKNKKNKKD